MMKIFQAQIVTIHLTFQPAVINHCTMTIYLVVSCGSKSYNVPKLIWGIVCILLMLHFHLHVAQRCEYDSNIRQSNLNATPLKSR